MMEEIRAKRGYEKFISKFLKLRHRGIHLGSPRTTETCSCCRAIREVVLDALDRTEPLGMFDRLRIATLVAYGTKFA